MAKQVKPDPLKRKPSVTRQKVIDVLIRTYGWGGLEHSELRKLIYDTICAVDILNEKKRKEPESHE